LLLASSAWPILRSYARIARKRGAPTGNSAR
jgi:hypothetical protein